jgi:hypothetical protein
MARPKKFEIGEKELSQIETMAGLGMPLAEIARCMGMGQRTFEAYKSQREDIQAAYKSGRAKGLEKATKALWRLIDEGEKTAIYFFLKTQWGWRETDKREIEVKGRLELEAVQALDPDEARELAAVIAKKGLPEVTE